MRVAERGAPSCGVICRIVRVVVSVCPTDSLDVSSRRYGSLDRGERRVAVRGSVGAGAGAPLSSFLLLAAELGSSGREGEDWGGATLMPARSRLKESSATLTRLNKGQNISKGAKTLETYCAPRRRSLRRSARASRPANSQYGNGALGSAGNQTCCHCSCFSSMRRELDKYYKQFAIVLITLGVQKSKDGGINVVISKLSTRVSSRQTREVAGRWARGKHQQQRSVTRSDRHHSRSRRLQIMTRNLK